VSPKDIRVGKTYRNRGAGRTFRTVTEIRPITEPETRQLLFYGAGEAGDTVVIYRQRLSNSNGRHEKRALSIRSFAAWAGSEVSDA